MNQYDSEAVMFDLKMPFSFSKTGRCMWVNLTGAIGTTSGEIVFRNRYDRISGNAYGPQLRSSDRGADVPTHWGRRESMGRIQNPHESGLPVMLCAIPARM
mgnify:CR=1 FL=1